MGQRNIQADELMNQYQLVQAVAEVRSAVPTSPAPIPGQFWFNSTPGNGTGNGVLQFRDNSGNNVTLATGGSALSNAFTTITDGTTPAVANAGATPFKLIASGSGLAIVTQNDDPTNGDNATFTLNSATSGNNKVLLTGGTGKIAASTIQEVIALADLTDVSATTGSGSTVPFATGPTLTNPVIAGSAVNTAGALSYAAGYMSVGVGASSENVLTIANSVAGITGKTFTTPRLTVSNSPTAAVAGQLGFATTDLQYADGTNVRTVANLDGSQTFQNKTLTLPTISDFTNAQHNHQNAAGGSTLVKAAMPSFDTYVQANRIDQLAVPTGPVSFNSQKLTNVANGTLATDGVNLGQLQSTQAGLDFKSSVRAASTANVAVTYTATAGALTRGQITAAPNTLDGVTLAANNRILLKNQTAPAQNGIWVVTTLGTGANGVWDRATDFDEDTEVTSGAFTFVSEGTANGTTQWVLSTADPIVIGGSSGTNLTFVQFFGPSAYTAGAGLTQTGTTFNAIANANGSIVVNADDISASTALTSAHSVISGGTAGVLARTATNTVTARSLAAGTGVSITNTDFSAGNPSISITSVGTAGTYTSVTTNGQGQVTAGADIVTANGIVTRTGAGTFINRNIAVASTGRLTITNPAGTAGDFTLDLATVVTGATSDGWTYDNYGRTTAYASRSFQATMTGATSTFTHTHNFNTRDVLVQVYDTVTPFTEIYPEIRRTTVNSIDVVFGANLGSAAYRVVIRAAN